MREHPLTRVLRELQVHRLCTELPLNAFSREELQAYLARRFPDSQFPAAVAEMLYRRGGGQPLFTVNLLDYLLAEGHLRQTGGWWTLAGGDRLAEGVPETIQALIEHQLVRLSAEEQHLLEAAGVAGMEVSAALLAAVLDEDLLTVEGYCHTLARRGLMLTEAGVAEWPDGTVAGNYAFRHALYGDVLYQRLPPARRVALHRRLGERLEAAYGDRTGDIAPELARHFEAGRDWIKAIHYLRLAALQAAGRFGNREALGYLSRVLGLVERLPEEERLEQMRELLQRSAALHCSMYHMEDAIKDLLALLHCARTVGDRLWEVKALVDLSRMYYLVDPGRCLEWVDEALERSETLADENEKALVKGCHGHWHLTYVEWRNEYEAACRAALAVARATRDPRILSRYLVAQVVCESYRSNYRAASTAAEEGKQWAERAGDGYLFMVFQSLQSMAMIFSGAWGEARDILRQGLAMAEKNGNPMQTRRFRSLNLMLEVEAGHFEEARAQGEDVCAMRVPGDSITANMDRILLAKAHLGFGDYPRALRHLEEMTRRVERDGMLLDGVNGLWFPRVYGEYWLAMGNWEQARQQALRLCAIAAPRPERTFLALGHRMLAQIALAERNWTEAASQVEKALTVIEGAEVPLAAWRAYDTAADFHALQGREAEARFYADQATAMRQALAASLGDPSEPGGVCITVRT